MTRKRNVKLNVMISADKLMKKIGEMWNKYGELADRCKELVKKNIDLTPRESGMTEDENAAYVAAFAAEWQRREASLAAYHKCQMFVFQEAMREKRKQKRGKKK